MLGDNFSYVAYLASSQSAATSAGFVVSAKKTASDTVKYFNDIRCAVDYVKDNRSNASDTEMATIDVLADISDAKGFRIRGSGTRDKENKRLTITKATGLTLNLNNHTLTFLVSIQGDRSSKAMQLGDYNEVVINGGSTGGKITIAEQDPTGKFERIIRSYCDLTITNVTLDGTNLLQPINYDGAAVCHSSGKLTLNGNTSIIVKDNDSSGTYYALSGSQYAEDNNSYIGGYQMEVDTTSETPIKNIALYTFTDSKDVPSGGYGYNPYNKTDVTDNNALILKQGNIGEVVISDLANTAVNNKTAFDFVNIDPDEGKTVTINGVEFDSTTQALNVKADGVQRVLKAGWNDGSFSAENRWFYVVKDAGEEANTGKAVVTADGATNSSVLGGVDETNKVAAIPDGVEATTAEGYNIVKTNYYNSNQRVQFSFTAPVTVQAATLFNENAVTLDSSENTVGGGIIGNALSNEIRGGKGDSLTGGAGDDIFVYSGGKNLIADYSYTGTNGVDTVKVSGLDVVTDGTKINKVGTDNKDLEIDFGDDGALSITGGADIANGVTVLGNNQTPYTYSADYIAHGTNGITLTSYYADKITADDENSAYKFADINNYRAINAAAVSKQISIEGDKNDNTITGSAHGNSLHGGNGNDILIGSNSASDVFRYTAGNDTIGNYQFNGGDNDDITDKLIIDATKIKSAKSSRRSLAFTIDSKNSLTFSNEENDVEKVSLNGGGFLTKDGVVNVSGTAKKFDLFAGSKGRIDLVNDTIYKGEGIASVDASAITNSVTLTADSLNGAFAFASKKKKDLLEYNGAAVSISGYESGIDRINIGNVGAIYDFEVDNTSGNLAISVGAASTVDVVTLLDSKDKEILLHDADSRGNSFSKMVFHETGVLYNKAKPTEITLSGNAANQTQGVDTAKKIFAVGLNRGISIQSGANKVTLDASEAFATSAGNGVSLIGGEKNNRFIGSARADVFEYKGGKDVVDGFQVPTTVSGGSSITDSISFDANKFDINDAKITVSKKSLKFKFDSKNTLTLKSDSAIESLRNANGDVYTYSKNAIGDGDGNVSLTSQFSGSYKIEDGINNVDGGAVSKNLTFKGSEQAETLTGGTKKTTFKGGGAADGTESLIGGSGKDIFFYAKGDKGTTDIADFEFGKDKIKIANGTLYTITNDGSSIKFAMTSGKKGDNTDIAYFNLKSAATYNSSGAQQPDTFAPDKTLIKANSTYYWFAQDAVTGTNDDGNPTTFANAGDLITVNRKVSANEVRGYDIIDLGYSTNLAKSGVAIKVTGTFENLKPTLSSGDQN